MKHLTRYIYYVAIAAAIGTTPACTKKLEKEVTSLEFSRQLSPTGLSAIVVDRTGLRLEWTKVAKAETYEIELSANADFSGTPLKSVKDFTFDQLPYTVKGLDGETSYWVRVKAIGADISDSKWSTVTFKTAPEQIFLAINPEELKFNEVTLRWPAGEVANTITLTPGNITHNITANEIAAGAVTITGLKSETDYTAVMKRGTLTRGTMAFTTPIDLGGATKLTPGDDVVAALQNATAGTVFALMPGVYNINKDIAISKSISVKGAKPSDKPVVNGAIFRLSASAGLQLRDLVIDGTGSQGGNQTIIYDADVTIDAPYAELRIEDCIIRNYVKGLIYGSKKALVQSITLKGNIIYNVECNEGDFIDFRQGIPQTLSFTNNTVYNCAKARDLFRMDGNGSTNFPGTKSIINVSNNTFNNNVNGTGSQIRMFYVRAANEITVSKNIIVNSAGIHSAQSETNFVAFSGNNYFNAPNYTTKLNSNTKIDEGNPTKEDPGFANVANGDFTISNVILKGTGVGDPRWIK